jgi:hypothetical protein
VCAFSCTDKNVKQLTPPVNTTIITQLLLQATTNATDRNKEAQKHTSPNQLVSIFTLEGSSSAVSLCKESNVFPSEVRSTSPVWHVDQDLQHRVKFE